MDEEDEVLFHGEDFRLQREHGVFQIRAEDAQVGDERRASEEKGDLDLVPVPCLGEGSCSVVASGDVSWSRSTQGISALSSSGARAGGCKVASCNLNRVCAGGIIGRSIDLLLLLLLFLFLFLSCSSSSLFFEWNLDLFCLDRDGDGET